MKHQGFPPIHGEAHNGLSPIEDIIEDARCGRMFILVDEEDRENEGDLIIPAQMATPDAINFMATHGRGLICLSMTSERIDELGLPLMSANNASRHETNFTVSIEAREGVTTGISAFDRARTIAVAIDPSKTGADLASPGHVFPLRAKTGGVLVRAGHTEAAVDVSRLAGLSPAGVICEIMNDDGSMARLPDLLEFGAEHGLKIGTIADLIAFRRRNDNLVELSERRSATSVYGGDWDQLVFTDRIHGAEHIALIKGDISGDEPVLTRMHALDPIRDVLGLAGKYRLSDIGRSMDLVAQQGRGVVVLLRDLHMKITNGREPSPRVLRQYGLGAQVLTSLGLSKLILLSDSPQPVVQGLNAYGLEIVGTRPIHGENLRASANSDSAPGTASLT